MVFLLATSLVTGQATFSYSGPSLSVGQLFERVKSETAVRVETDGISHSQLYVKLDSVSVPELVHKVAEVTGASLSSIDGGGFRLSVGKGQIAKFVEEENKSRAESLSWAIDQQKKKLSDAMDWSESRATQRAATWSKSLENVVKDFGDQKGILTVNIGGTMDLPASMVLAKVLTTIKPERLISSDKIIRLSDKPNAFQQSLGMPMASIYKEFVQANNRLHDLSIPRSSNLELDFGLSRSKLAISDIAKTTVIVSCENPTDFGILVAITDNNGDVLGKASIRWNLPARTNNVPSVFEGKSEFKVPPELSRIANEMATSFATPSDQYSRGWSSGGEFISLGPDFRPRGGSESVLEEVRKQGLGTYRDLALKMVLEPKGKNVVAAVPNQVISKLIRASKQPALQELEVAKLFQSHRMTSKVEGDWLTVSSLNRARFLGERWSAEAADKLCVRLFDQRYVSGLEILEYLSTRGGDVQSDDLDSTFVQLFNKHAHNELVDNQAAWRLRAIADQLYKGPDSGEVSLNAQLQKQFGPFILDTSSHLGISGSGGHSAMFSDEWQRQWIGLLDFSEPLVRGMFKASISRQNWPCLYVKRNDEPYGFFRTTETLGQIQSLAKSPDAMADYGPDVRPFDTFTEAERVKTNIRVVWKFDDEKSYSGPIRGITSSTLSHGVPPGAKKWTDSTLPQSLKKEIEEAASRWKDY